MALLLSPAGSLDALAAAIDAGADEVYLGGTNYNARAGAKNFTAAQMIEAGKRCRDAGVRLHVTLNTLIGDREFPDVLEYVRFLQESVRPDAYILQDLGLAARIRELYPDAVLHASTQMRQHAAPGAPLLKSLGFSRVVLAREMRKEDILSYVRSTDLHTEVFVHGALCVCESGGCLMSSVIGRRSGNRGECAQPCRLPYEGKQPYPLSLKDNCLAEHLEELSSAGVTAFKIEGRMKSPAYVYSVTSVYRKLLDEHRGPTEEELDELENAFSRSGFTDGYYTGVLSHAMFGIRREEDKKRAADPRFRTRAPAVRRPYADTAAEAPFPLILPEKDASRILSPGKQLGYVARPEGPLPSSLTLFSDAARIDLPVFALGRTDLAGMEDRISVVLPRVTMDHERQALRRMLADARAAGITQATVSNLSDLPDLDGFVLHGDYPLNVYNRQTRDLLERFSFSSLFLSPEVSPLGFGPSAAAMEALGYGRIPLMHTETCIIRNIRGDCPEKNGKKNGGDRRCFASLVDRSGAVFPVLRAEGHRNTVYNAVPTYRLDRRKELRKAGVGLLTLLFTTETEQEMESVLRCFRESDPHPPFAFTRR